MLWPLSSWGLSYSYKTRFGFLKVILRRLEICIGEWGPDLQTYLESRALATYLVRLSQSKPIEPSLQIASSLFAPVSLDGQLQGQQPV